MASSHHNPIPAVDSLHSAMKIMPNMEYLLQGSVNDSSAEVLHNRLRGIQIVNYYTQTFIFICFVHHKDCVMQLKLDLRPFMTMKYVSVLVSLQSL